MRLTSKLVLIYAKIEHVFGRLKRKAAPSQIQKIMKPIHKMRAGLDAHVMHHLAESGHKRVQIDRLEEQIENHFDEVREARAVAANLSKIIG